MSLKEAIEEAYASAPNNADPIETIELDHPSFDQPVRVANAVDAPITLPLVKDGPQYEHTAVGVSVVLPGIDDDGPTPAKIEIGDPDGVLVPYLDDAVLAGGAISVTYRTYAPHDLTEPGDVITGLFLKNVKHDGDKASGELSFKQIDMQAFPKRIYDVDLYPALQNP